MNESEAGVLVTAMGAAGPNPHYKPPINRWRTVEVICRFPCLAGVILDSELSGALVIQVSPDLVPTNEPKPTNHQNGVLLMADSRLSEAEALKRCDEIGLTQGRPREVYSLYLATLWKPRDLAVFLQISADNVYQALSRAERAVKAHEEFMAEKRWREMHERRPGGMRIDSCTLDGVNGSSIQAARDVMELIANVEHCGAVSSGLLGKEGATIHVGKLGRAKRLTVECVAQLLAGTMQRERTLFPQRRPTEFEYPIRKGVEGP